MRLSDTETYNKSHLKEMYVKNKKVMTDLEKWMTMKFGEVWKNDVLAKEKACSEEELLELLGRLNGERFDFNWDEVTLEKASEVYRTLRAIDGATRYEYDLLVKQEEKRLEEKEKAKKKKRDKMAALSKRKNR